jgi:hypothetical protein
MDKFKNFLKAVRNYPRNLYHVLSGNAEREAQALQAELKELEQRTGDILEEVKDNQALQAFRCRKAADYFNEVAAREPEMAQEYQRLSKLAATVDLGKMRGDINAYQPGEEDNREWHRVRERYADEIRKFSDARIDEFIAQDPARWERLQKNKPPAP